MWPLIRVDMGGMMTIDERIRHELHQRLDEVLGVDAAAVLMSHLPPAGWSDVVTREHLDHVLEVRFAQVHARFDQVVGSVDARFDQVVGSIDARFAQLEAQFDARSAQVDARFDRLEERFDERFETFEHRITAEMRGEFIAAMAQQTRTMIFALIGAIVSISLLAFSLAAIT
ncbi:hypothetical protein BH23ACT10_BH23ACT10_40150 [soil metagenome]